MYELHEHQYESKTNAYSSYIFGCFIQEFSTVDIELFIDYKSYIRI